MILATYNEAENLTQLIEALEGIVEDQQLVVVVDDNSPDGTGLIAQQLSSKFGNIIIVNRPSNWAWDQRCESACPWHWTSASVTS